MKDRDCVEVHLAQLLALEEDHFLAGFHHYVQKGREKALHDRYIKQHIFKNGDLVLMYYTKFTKFPRNFQMHWLGLYVIKDILDGGTVQLAKMNGLVVSSKDEWDNIEDLE